MEFSSSSKIYKHVFTTFFILFLANVLVEAHGNSPYVVSRSSFPDGFLFGAGTSALQVEGSVHEGGRGPTAWDEIIQNAQGKGTIKDIEKYDTMIEHYKRYKEDVQVLKKLGIDSYRFSIQWSRILPDGTLDGGINQEGLDFYNNLINELLANGITPFVTILHFDMPLAIVKNGAFTNRSVVNHFKDYSDILFKTYGDRVKHWTTLNEPDITALFNYMHGFDNFRAEKCQTTKICKEAYVVIHNYLLSHATSVQLYREKYKATQGGEIGIVTSIEDYLPYSGKLEDISAMMRVRDFTTNWILEPLFHGHYPIVMELLVGDRLPKITLEERKLLEGSVDFVGLNYYRSYYVRNELNKSAITAMNNFDSVAVKEVVNIDGIPLGYKDNVTGENIYPEGLYNVLIYLKEKYNPKLYITENGIDSGTMVSQPLKDRHRINYIATHINHVKQAIDDGVNVKGFFVWAAFDTFEFHGGYSGKQGLIYVDFNNSLKRVPKQSARWYRKFLTGKSKHI